MCREIFVVSSEILANHIGLNALYGQTVKFLNVKSGE